MPSTWKINHHLSADSPANRRQQLLDFLLANRGLTRLKDQQEFLEPTAPDKIKLGTVNIDVKAVNTALSLIKQAKDSQKLIVIYGDFDADGITSTAILWESLNAVGAKVMPYLPSRVDPVRGLSPDGVDALIKQHGQPELIITVDNGISATQGVNHAHKLGIKVIITDHHQPKKTLPSADSIIHTTALAGVGVSWFFSRQVYRHFKQEPLVNLDLAAIGTIADMVPALKANRSLIKFGLKKLRLTSRPGLKHLAKISKLNLSEIEPFQVGYVLSPRLNALGRLANALDGLRLLCTNSSTKAQNLAASISDTNLIRQEKTDSMYQEAKALWAKQNQDQKLIFVASPNFHEGIVGLVAGRLAEEFNRPAFVVAQGEVQSKISGRSPKTFNVIATLRKHQHLLLDHGGHPQAAGFSVLNEHLAELEQILIKEAESQLQDSDLLPTLDIDCQLEFTDINWPLFAVISKLEPFGFANPEPVFSTLKVKILDLRTVGQDSRHLQLTVQKDQINFKAIAFSQGGLSKSLKPGATVDIAYSILKNTWNSHESLQLKIIQLLAE